jgi:flap endonuclease-1
MGIHGLSKVIQEHASPAMKQLTMKQLARKKIAVDANLSLYQFLAAVRLPKGGGALSNSQGEITRY